jgi:hypothetical protein
MQIYHIKYNANISDPKISLIIKRISKFSLSFLSLFFFIFRENIGGKKGTENLAARKERRKEGRKGKDLTTMMKRILNARISLLFFSLYIYIHFEN